MVFDPLTVAKKWLIKSGQILPGAAARAHAKDSVSRRKPVDLLSNIDKQSGYQSWGQQ